MKQKGKHKWKMKKKLEENTKKQTDQETQENPAGKRKKGSKTRSISAGPRVTLE